MILNVGEEIGLDREKLQEAISLPANLDQLESNWQGAKQLGLFGVPSFVIGEELFWGSDRIDYVLEHLHGLRLARL